MAFLTTLPACLLLLAATSMAVEPWAETQELTECAIDPSSCLIGSSWEIVQQPFADIRPFDASYRASEGMDRSIFGRRFSVVENWSTGRSGLGFSVGNETGDQVLQEVPHGLSQENSNPATSLWFTAPTGSPLRAFGRFEQVDHFSDAWHSQRSRVLGEPNLSSPWPNRRYAWFGENLPPFSLAGAGLGLTRHDVAMDASFVDGWLWQHLPLSDRLSPWKLVQFDSKAQFRKHLAWSHRRQSLRSEADPSRQILSIGEIAWSPLGDSSATLGTTYEFLSVRGKTESHERTLGMMLRLRLRRDKFIWSGWHHLDAHGHAIRDTATWSDSIGRSAISISLSAGSTDRPDGIRPESENTLLGNSTPEASGEERFLRLEARCTRRTGPIAWGVNMIPWLVANPWAYPQDTTLGGRRPLSLSGNLYGNKLRLTAQVGCASKGLQASVQHAVQTGQAADSVDLTPPSWAGAATGWIGSELGLSLRAGISWSTGWLVRNQLLGPIRTSSGLAGQAWLEQTLFDDRLRLSLAALDLFASDTPDLPLAGQRRTRLLVSGNWKL